MRRILICRSVRKNGYLAVYEKKQHFWYVENISDKRLRIDVQPAHTNGVERILWSSTCTASSEIWKCQANFDVSPLEKIMWTPMDAL